MNRKTYEVLIVLKCKRDVFPMDAVYSYAKWNGQEFLDLVYKIVTCADYNDILECKDILNNVS